MEITSIEKVRYEYDTGGYPVLTAEVNGREVYIPREKAIRLDKYANLGTEFEDDAVVLVPEFDTRLFGFTNDIRYLRIVQKFVDDVDNGRFRPGPVQAP